MATMNCVPALGVLLFASITISTQADGVLADLYKKAAENDEPTLLVLGSDKDHLETQVHNSWPYSLLKKSQLHSRDRSLNHHNEKRQLRKEQDRKWLQSFQERRDQRNRNIGDQAYHHINYRDKRNRNNDKRMNNDKRYHYNDNRNYYDDDRYHHSHDRHHDNEMDHVNDRRDYIYDKHEDRHQLSNRIRHNSQNRERNEKYRTYKHQHYDTRNIGKRHDGSDRSQNNRNRHYSDRYHPNQDNQNRNLRNRNRKGISIDNALRATIENSLTPKTSNPHPHVKALQSTVVTNILRASNYFNCDAREQCRVKCVIIKIEKKQDECYDTCDIEFDCDESDDECGDDDCELPDSCADYDSCGDTNPSTRGVKFN